MKARPKTIKYELVGDEDLYPTSPTELEEEDADRESDKYQDCDFDEAEGLSYSDFGDN